VIQQNRPPSQLQWFKSSRLAKVCTATNLNTVGSPTNYDVICFPIIEWDHRFQRPQQLMTLFAMKGIAYSFALNFHDRGDQVEWWQVTDHIFQIQLPGPTQLNRFLERMPVDAVPQLLQALCEFCEQAGIRDAACMVQLPFWAPLALGLRRRYGWKVVFDCMDEHEGLTILRPEMLQDEATLARESDLVLASAQKLWDKHAGQARRCLRLPNGADFDHFNRLDNEALLADLPRLSSVIMARLWIGSMPTWCIRQRLRDRTGALS
jgi:hypothetical protein